MTTSSDFSFIQVEFKINIYAEYALELQMTKPISTKRSSDGASEGNSKGAQLPERTPPEERLTDQELLWKNENKLGIEAYNNYIAKHGLFNDRMRKF
jgi:hypothetical protein